MSEKKIGTIIIDDEKPAITALNHLLDSYCPEVEVLRTFTESSEAISFVKTESPDLAFVDIKMPNKDGISLLNELTDSKTRFIFTTAYEEYALRAWKTNAIGYLLKPVDPDDLTEAILKYFNLQNVPQSIEAHTLKIGTDFYKAKNIIAIEASGSYSKLVSTQRNEILVSRNLKSLLGELPLSHFLRIHRSTVINVNHVRSFRLNERRMMMVNDHNYEVSERRLGSIQSYIKENNLEW